MEQQSNQSSSNQGNVIKWGIAILLFATIPPLSVYYIWKNLKVFSKKLYIILWLFGAGNLIMSFAILSMFSLETYRVFQEIGIVIPYYINIILYSIIFLSAVQIIFGFLIKQKQKLLSDIPKNYINIALIILLINTLLIPIAVIAIELSIVLPLYQQLLF